MPKIDDVIARCYDDRADVRDPADTDGIAVHRCGVDTQTGVVLGYDAVAISDHFTGKDRTYPEVSRATGGQNAYTFMIGGDLGPPEHDGRIWQLLPLSEVGYHARRFSRPAIGVGLIFDGRYAPASVAQYDSLVWLLSVLCLELAQDPYRKIKGHGEMRGAHNGSKAPGQPAACPGDLLRMNILRDDTAGAVKSVRRRRVTEAGIVW